jgi:hypothetical protein
MEISVAAAEGRVPVTIFRVAGAITSNAELELAARESFDSGARNILIDLTSVPYIATSGLRALNFIYTLLRTDSPAESDEAVKRGISAGTFYSPHLKLLNPSPHVLEALKVAGYDMFLEIHRDERRAVESF